MGTLLSGISDICGLNFDISSGGYRCVFCENRFEAEGVTALISFDSNSIALKFKKKALMIEGENLAIKSYSKGYISIKGSVSQIIIKQV